VSARIRWILLANALLGSVLAGAAIRIFIVAMPTVANNLDTDIVGVSWALLAFQLSTIGLSLVFGKIGDIYGHYKVLGGGHVVMMIGSLLCGLSATIGQLIVFRMIQGVGAAMTQSVGRALAAQAMPEEKGGRAQGLMTTAFHSGFLLGPSLGGLIIDSMGWRWTFFFLVPFAAAGVLLTALSWRHSPAPSRRSAVDYLGATLLVGSATILFILLDRRTMNLMDLELRILLVLILAASFSGFLFREAYTTNPIVNLSLFKIRMFTFSTVSLLIVSTNYSLTAFLLPFYLQEILRLSPSFMGMLFMAAPIFTVTLGPVSGLISDRVGPRLPATTGTSLLVACLFFGTLLSTDSHWILPTLMLALLGMANGFFNPANSVGMLSSVPKEHIGLATGTVSVMFGLGNLFGITLASFLLTTAFQMYTGTPATSPTPTVPAAFVAAMNYTFLVAIGIGLVAIISSAMRSVSTKPVQEYKGS
jgi:EmrB/QacA subfamily drug resistance transporter